jgi:hypothetical protein
VFFIALLGESCSFRETADTFLVGLVKDWRIKTLGHHRLNS